MKKEANYFVVHWSHLSPRFAIVTSKIAFLWEAVVFTHINRKLKNSLMFILCIIRCSRKNQKYALICTTPSFYVLAPMCIGSGLPSSESVLGPSELLEMQIEWVVYHMICGYVTCMPNCCGSIYCVSQLSQLGDATDRTMTIRHTGHVTTHYVTYHPFDLHF
jgi:hypothetical protein